MLTPWTGAWLRGDTSPREASWPWRQKLGGHNLQSPVSLRMSLAAWQPVAEAETELSRLQWEDIGQIKHTHTHTCTYFRRTFATGTPWFDVVSRRVKSVRVFVCADPFHLISATNLIPSHTHPLSPHSSLLPTAATSHHSSGEIVLSNVKTEQAASSHFFICAGVRAGGWR